MADRGPPREIETLGQALEWKAREFGKQPFLQYRNEQRTYAELNRRVNAIANGLESHGIESGEMVCLFMYNGLEYVSLYFALAKLGAVVAPIDTRFTGETLTAALEKSGAETVFIDDRTRGSYEEVRADLRDITSEYIVGKQPDSRRYRSFETLRSGNTESPPDTDCRQSDTVSVTFVQRRATEQPRGVCLPQYSYINTGWEVTKEFFGFDTDHRIFTTLPLYSILTFQVGIVGAMFADGEFVLSDPFDPDRYWQQVESCEATVILYLGRLLSVLQSQYEGSEPMDNPVEMALGHGFGFGTDETLIEEFEEQFDITVLEGYGNTQTSTLATFNTPDERRIGSSGRPVSHADVEIVDENDWPVETGESGEIVIRPKRPNTMFQGYLDEPEQTVDICRNQWIHTGDIGYKDEDGFVYFIANEDNSIYRGRIAGRVSSLEIEGVIDDAPDVKRSAVVGIENNSGTEEIKAVVVPEEGAELSPIDVYQHCKQSLPYIKVPRYIEIRSGLPRNPTGKIRRMGLRNDGTESAWDREAGYEFSQ
jgi:acyl-CoA synthetase (AMP-forming)/AMP-acid ligase II